MKKSTKAALLSAFVLPGAGHIFLKKYIPGVALVGASLGGIYYLTSKDGKIAVGHGMCSGAFALSKNGKYKVRFDLLDASGNSFGKWSEWTKIDNFQTIINL